MTAKPPIVSVVILNWNRKELLDRCIASVEAERATLPAIEIIVVDNGSADGSCEMVERKFPDVRLIRLPQNDGYSVGNNVGMRHAAGKYVFLLNNDTELVTGCIRALAEEMEKDPMIGMAACKILLDAQSRIIDSKGMNVFLDGLGRQREHGLMDTRSETSTREILFPSGCAGLYRKSMLAETGLFDERFFAYCEDDDLGMRCRWAGYKALYVPYAEVIHRFSGTLGAFALRKIYLIERNHLWYAVKTLPWPLLIILPLTILARHLIHAYSVFFGKTRTGGYVEKNSLTQVANTILEAYWDAITGLYPVLRDRGEIMRKAKTDPITMTGLIFRHLAGWREMYRPDEPV